MIVQGADGRQALVTDTWSATDGRHHEIDVFYENRLGGSAPVVSFPWVGGFTSYPPGYVQKSPATAPFSFFTRASASAADGDPAAAQGAITLQDKPTTLRFRSSSALWTQYVRTVTPETPARVAFGFSWATAQADLASLLGQAERALGPTQCLVPNTVGKTLTTAKRLLVAAHCKLGKVKYTTSRKQKQGLRHPAGPPPVDDAAGRQHRDAAREHQARQRPEDVVGRLPCKGFAIGSRRRRSAGARRQMCQGSSRRSTSLRGDE